MSQVFTTSRLCGSREGNAPKPRVGIVIIKHAPHSGALYLILYSMTHQDLNVDVKYRGYDGRDWVEDLSLKTFQNCP